MIPFHIDGARVGGSQATHRHGFNHAQQAPAKKAAPRFIQAPPKRIVIGEGLSRSPELSQAQISNLRKEADQAIAALQLELEAMKYEADVVAPATLRVEPDLYKGIDVIGPYFTPPEVRSQIMVDLDGLTTEANRLLRGAASSYISPEQAQSLTTIVSDARALSAYLQQFDIQPLTGGNGLLAEQHLESHIGNLREAIDEVEIEIVSAEAGSVPVTEPVEKGLGLGSLLAIGALVAIGLVIADVV